MERPTGSRRRRGYGGIDAPSNVSTSARSSDSEDLPTEHSQRAGATIIPPSPWNLHNYAIVTVMTIIAFGLRFYKLNHPDQVAFDEVHFGKFASYYITGEYYFDVHPPFAKLLLGLAGWFVGYDGSFEFETIGDSYTAAHVPYVGLRALPAFLGSLTVPLVYMIMLESGYPTLVAAFSTVLILLDNGHIGQTRLILLDAQLIFFVTLSLYTYVKFRKVRYLEFTPVWWGWLCATGVALACSLGCKMVGLFTFFTIGTAVLVDLWEVLDVRKEGHTMDYFYKHFIARTVGLIILPAIVYLSFFWVHFALLPKSGTGDAFMSPAFQETLRNNELLMNSQEIRYYDTITIKHKETKVFLHSHPEQYPLRYDDGRVSSQGQQVTGYNHDDVNNHWIVVPTKALPETGRGRIVRHEDIIQLTHVATDTKLLTHDVASPLMPTNTEFTTVSHDEARGDRYNDTLFQVQIDDADPGQAWKSKSGHFKLIHMPTRVALWTHPKPLPEWAFKQQEINGNKKVHEKSNIWYVNEVVAVEGGGEDVRNRTGQVATKEPSKMNFFKKFAELQFLMLQHNAGLTAHHPYASSPLNWPFLLSGISFWTDNEKEEQVYLIGNIVGWWTCVMALSIYTGVIAADLLARRRGTYPIPYTVRNRLWNNAGFFFIAWAFHYFPFYLMNRQLFLHHYLPAHVASALAAGAVYDFIFSELNNFPISYPGPKTRARRPTRSDIFKVPAAITLTILTVLMFAMFLFIAPLTYGTPTLTGEAVNRRRLLSSWTLHFAAKKTTMD
ncbi:O-mannosyltransferase [Sistotremastrum suecicum HHB10207 ss-3]|uniref:Dolichyl-phosphate-mannose--protein mannosyltransferase n=1 Tax=Sistotremastrum suecicum HHB10207 ss-3 TaxID=1314776 RepID=A0A166EB29_9AGAM|nr:O-mannosyltransferase [Sistotremastrum suecicum HHB10207 ss-3]